ncbi:MAG: arylesterase, partial [Xanthomonadales bacterium]|nr:arylesterase [Xanthomonadales bacterium]NIN60177.1 arylesterase [Xanthomonadales bacterium]NIN75543.1 arylesterase [Xanthomonadales bacterium]NIO12834.1 arylesterase [Xanthomonadales bacterium]NIP12570.1 arylesterase [Xanthomonadales bacterium]
MRIIKPFFLLWAALWAAAVPASTEPPVILVLGDSLSAGYNMDLDQAWPSLLQARLSQHGYEYRVFNSSITGDTTQGGV